MKTHQKVEDDLDPVSQEENSQNKDQPPPEDEEPDEEFKEISGLDDDEAEEANLDGLDSGEEYMIGEKLSKTKGKTPRKHQKEEEIKDVEEGSDIEGDENVFIDNLPKDEQSIKILLKEVNRHIRELERKFFEEEDSDTERDLQRHMHTPNATHPEFETNPIIK